MRLTDSELLRVTGVLEVELARKVVAQFLITKELMVGHLKTADIVACAESALELTTEGCDGLRLVNCARHIQGDPFLPIMSNKSLADLARRRLLVLGARATLDAAQEPSPAPPKPKRYRLGPEFYQTPDWQKARYQALLRGKGCCACCGATAKPGRPLHVDHIKPKSAYPELALDVSNLQILCGACNMGKGAWDMTDWRQEAPPGPAEGSVQDKVQS
jgi:hypothetical protein